MATWDDVVAIGLRFPGSEEATSFRSPALRVAGRRYARLRTEAGGGLELVCTAGEKREYLRTGGPALYTVPHDAGRDRILVDLDLVDDGTLVALIRRAWSLRAPRRLREGAG